MNNLNESSSQEKTISKISDDLRHLLYSNLNKPQNVYKSSLQNPNQGVDQYCVIQSAQNSTNQYITSQNQNSDTNLTNASNQNLNQINQTNTHAQKINNASNPQYQTPNMLYHNSKNFSIVSKENDNLENQLITSINSPKDQNYSIKQEFSSLFLSFFRKNDEEEKQKDHMQILTEINHFLEKVCLEKENLNVTIQKLNNEINSYKAIVEAKENEIKDLQDINKLTKEQNDKIINDFHKNKQVNEEQEQEIARLKKENESQKNTISKKENKIKRLKDIITSNKYTINSQNKKINELIKECNSLREKINKNAQQNSENKTDDNQEKSLIILGQYKVRIVEEEGLVLKNNKFLSEEQMEKNFLLNKKIFDLVGKLVNEPIKLAENISYYKYFDGFDLLPSINSQVHRAKKSIKGTIKDKNEVILNILNGFMRLINEANIIVTDIANGNNIMISKNSNDVCFIDLDSSIDIISFEENSENSKMLLITMNNLWSITVSLFTSTQITNECRKKYNLRGSSGVWLIYFIQDNKSLFNDFFERLIDQHQSRNLTINDIKIFIDEIKECVLNRWK